MDDCRAVAPLDAALSSAATYALSEKSENTRRAYRADLAQFVGWCGRVRATALPATAATVAAYFAGLADDGLKVSTIARRAAAIAYAHKLAGEASPIADERVKAVLRGIRRKIGVAPDAKAPATAEILSKIVKKLPATLAGKRDRALLLIGFAAALRRSELVDLRVNDVERTAVGAFLRIGRSKTDQDGLGAQIAIAAGGKFRVLDALDDWISAAAILEGPIFRAVDRHGRVSQRALSGDAVAEIVKRAAKAAKLDPALFSGHSLRAGFVTSALERGADLFRIMDVTRHREVETLRVYDRRAKAFVNHPGKGFL
jgi:site-specific recombinase XerD